MPGGSSGGSSGGASGGSSGGASGGAAGGGAGGTGGGIRGLGGQMPGVGGGSSGSGGANGSAAGGNANCDDAGLPDGFGGPRQGGACDGDVGRYPGETDAERKARLEKSLDESVDDFDGVIAEEQREISTVGRDTEGFGGGPGGSGGTRVGLGKQATGGVKGTGDSQSASNASGSGATASVDSMTEEEIAKRTPADIPDLVSEDIVAKQLREAALAEDDPKLRERLWEEYRNYNKL
jgi:hypothetical protein